MSKCEIDENFSNETNDTSNETDNSSNESDNESNTSDDQKFDDSKLSTGEIAGIAVGIALFVALVITMSVVAFIMKQKKEAEAKAK